MIPSSFNDISEEGPYKFANMKATSNAETEFVVGCEPTETPPCNDIVRWGKPLGIVIKQTANSLISSWNLKNTVFDLRLFSYEGNTIQVPPAHP